jgi:hypothetical protein
MAAQVKVKIPSPGYLLILLATSRPGPIFPAEYHWTWISVGGLGVKTHNIDTILLL